MRAPPPLILISQGGLHFKLALLPNPGIHLLGPILSTGWDRNLYYFRKWLRGKADPTRLYLHTALVHDSWTRSSTSRTPSSLLPGNNEYTSQKRKGNRLHAFTTDVTIILMHSYYARINTVFFTAVYSLAAVGVFYALLYPPFLFSLSAVGRYRSRSRASSSVLTTRR